MRLRTPGEIVASLPALLGYHAERSIVLLVLGGERHRLRLTMRLDLPDARDPAVWRAVTQAFTPGIAQADGDEAVLVLLDGDEESARALNAALSDVLAEHGMTMRDVLLVADGRYRSMLCVDLACCPPDGTPVPLTGAATAAAVSTGKVILANRNELRVEIAPPDGQAADRATKVLALVLSTARHGSLERGIDDMSDELDSACAAALAGDIPLDQAARLACLVAVGDYRDQAYLHLVENGARAHRALWGSVCRQLPAQHTVVPHVLFALSAYLQGEGALATVALEAAEATDAEHPSVTLLSDILAAGIQPGEVRAALARCMGPQD